MTIRNCLWIRLRLILAVPVFLTNLMAPECSHARALELIETIGPRCWMEGVDFSPDGSKIAGQCMGGQSYIWDFPSGRLVESSQGEKYFSPRWVYYADETGVFDAVSRLKLDFPRYGLHGFSQDSKLAVVLDTEKKENESIRIFDVKTHKLLSAFGSHVPRGVAFSPNNKVLASTHHDLVLLRDIRTGKRLAAFRGVGPAFGVVFNRSGRLLAVSTDNGSVSVWDVRNKRKLFSVNAGGDFVEGLRFSPNGKFLAFGEYGGGQVWLVDLARHRVVDHRPVSDHSCAAVAFSPDSRYLISASGDGPYLYKGHWRFDYGKVHVFRIKT